jgi:hypothetical protein
MKAVHYLLHKRQRKPKGQSRMESPGSPVTLGTQDTGRRQTKQKAKKINNTNPWTNTLAKGTQ